MGAPRVNHEEPDVPLGNGQAYVIFGSTSFQNSFNLTTLNGNNGFVINGTSLDMLGYSVNRLGDINGDGKNDIVIGAPYSSFNGLTNAGRAYVIFGANSFPSTLEASTLDGNNGFIINGVAAEDRLGYSVSGIGDINGDGKKDIIIGAPYSSFNGLANAGRAYVIFGATTFPSSFNLNSLNGNNGFIINGLSAGDMLGVSVSIGEDVNGDGIADIIIGADEASPNSLNTAGQAYVIFGTTTFPSPFNLNTLNGNNGFIVNGLSSNDVLGVSVDIGGDINGDGKADIIIGADGASSNGLNTTGQAYVIFGTNSFSSPFNLNTLNGNNGLVINGWASGIKLGFSVNIIPDINQDDKDDIIVGAVHASPGGITHAGQAYIILGASSYQSPFNVSELNGNNGFTVNGLEEHDALGWSVGGVYNVNGDGKNDIIIGAVDASPDSMIDDMMMQKTGQVYTIFDAQEQTSSASSLHSNYLITGFLAGVTALIIASEIGI